MGYRRATIALVVCLLGACDAPAAVPRIVNGVFTSLYPETGALLAGDDPATASLECSGVLVGCRTFLTAAHCVCGGRGADCQGAAAPDPAGWRVFLQHAGVLPVARVAVHPEYDGPVADVAVVELAEPVSGIAPAPMAFAAPPDDTVATIVGFGRSDFDPPFDYGLKRVGPVTTTECRDGLSDESSVCFEFAGEGADTCYGDSGGPLFVGGRVAGLTTDGTNPACEAIDLSYDANVATYRAWIAEVAGADVLRTSCGLLPQAGAADAPIMAASGELGPDEPVAADAFPVPAGTREARVTMNAIDDDVADFDLEVRLGGAATDPPDCVVATPSQFASCVFVRPAADTLYARVTRRAGAGPYQVTVTAFADEAALPRCAPGLRVRALRTGPAFVVRATLDDPTGEYAALDPRRTPLLVEVAGKTDVETGVPAGDPGWSTMPGRPAYRWRSASSDGLRRVVLRRRTGAHPAWSVRTSGRNLGDATRGHSTTGLRLVIDGRCFTDAP